jgi:hypothetical protein
VHDPHTEHAVVERDRLVEVAHGDTHVVDAWWSKQQKKTKKKKGSQKNRETGNRRLSTLVQAGHPALQ